MGVFNGFLKMMKLDDDYDDYDEFDELDDELLEEELSKSPFGRKNKKDSYEEKPKASKSNNIIQMQRKKGGVCVIKPTSYNEAVEITETLLAGVTVVLNLEGLDIDLSQRLVDYATGTCVAIDGNFKRISKSIFIISPRTISINGGADDLIGESFGC